MTVCKTVRVENYDSIKEQTTLVDCAKICRTTNNCIGFGHNKEDGTCYMSNRPLFGVKDPDAKYSDEFDESHLICNKIDPVTSIENILTKSQLINNAAYRCLTVKGQPASLFLSRDDRFKKIKDLDYLYRFEMAEPYVVREYDWDREGYPDEIYINKSKLISDMLSTDPGHVLETKTKIVRRPEHFDRVIDKIEEDYVEYEEFNVGDYLKPYHCINDLTKKRCMMKCNDDEECVGFEFNPEIKRFSNSTGEEETSKDLCCMKKNIGPFVLRENEYSFYKDGRFYLKSKYYPLSDESIDVSDESIDVTDESIDVSDESIDVSDESIDVTDESIDTTNQAIE